LLHQLGQQLDESTTVGFCLWHRTLFMPIFPVVSRGEAGFWESTTNYWIILPDYILHGFISIVLTLLFLMVCFLHRLSDLETCTTSYAGYLNYTLEMLGLPIDDDVFAARKNKVAPFYTTVTQPQDQVPTGSLDLSYLVKQGRFALQYDRPRAFGRVGLEACGG